MAYFRFQCVSCGADILGFYGGGDRQLASAEAAARAAGAVYQDIRALGLDDFECPRCSTRDNGSFHDIQQKGEHGV